jgi:hypothetical protein
MKRVQGRNRGPRLEGRPDTTSFYLPSGMICVNHENAVDA